MAAATLVACTVALAGCGTHVAKAAGASGSNLKAGAGTEGTGSDPSTSSSSTTTTTLARLKPPVTVVEIGDSLGEDLGYGLHDVLANDSKVTVVQAAKGDSGLVEPQFYDWPQHLSELLAQYHPQVVVVFLGGNDVQNFFQGSALETFGTPGWRAAYGRRVAAMMTEATAAGARVLWVGMPIMQDPRFSAEMQILNRVYRRQAALHPGVTYMSSWSLFTTSSGQYTATTTGPNGQSILLRDPDGIHIALGANSGADVLGQAVVKKMKALYGLP